MRNGSAYVTDTFVDLQTEHLKVARLFLKLIIGAPPMHVKVAISMLEPNDKISIC